MGKAKHAAAAAESSTVVATVETMTPEVVETALAGQALAEAETQQETVLESDGPEEAPRQAFVVCAPQGLHLRRGPGREFAVVTVLEEGEVVELLPLHQDVAVPGWVPILVMDTPGWAMADFLRPAEA